MPVLAERKRRSKWSAGGQALWSTDSNGIKFGREMMEKMGWKVGEGLGVHRQGIKNPLKIRFKNDNKGIGYKENDNEWIQQQFEFEELLSKLSPDKEEVSNKLDANMVKSLEERSRHSKARVHYHKFTRGKDLAKYSKKDLECILGRNEKESSSSNQSQVEDSPNPGAEVQDLVTFNAGSMVDYFAKKMQQKISTRNQCLTSGNPEKEESSPCSNSKDELEENIGNAMMESDEKKKKKSKRKKEKDKESCDKTDVNDIPSDYEMKSVSEGRKKNKKKKFAQSDHVHENRDCEYIQVAVEEECSEYKSNVEGNEVPGEKLKKHKKKRKKEENHVEEFDTINREALNDIENNNAEYREAGEKVKKKRKKKASKENCELIIDEDDAGSLKEKIKKMKKCPEAENFFNEEESVENKNDSNAISNAEISAKKRKREKGADAKGDGGEETVGEEPIIYKGELLKNPFSLIKNSQNKLLNLIYCTNIEKFCGSNLSGLTGYGVVNYR